MPDRRQPVGGPLAARPHRGVPEPRLLRRLPARGARAPGRAARRARGRAGAIPRARPEGRLDAARAALGAFVGADPDDLAFIGNATGGVNAVLRSLRLRGRATSCSPPITPTRPARTRSTTSPSAAARASSRSRCRSRSRPGRRSWTPCWRRSTPRTRLALLDHITSPTGLILPIARLVAEPRRPRRSSPLVDGAHAPGMIPLDLRALGAAYYSANCHKWLCAPKGSAFLCVRRDRQPTFTRSRSATARSGSGRAAPASGSSSTGPAPQDPDRVADRAEGHRLPGAARARRLARADGAQPRARARGAPAALRRRRHRARRAPTR